MGIDNYNVRCGGCPSWGSNPGAPQGLGVVREAACWKVGGDGDMSASVQVAERCAVGQAKGALLGLLGLVGR